MTLPQFQSADRSFNMMQNQWAAQLDPFLSNPIMDGYILQNVALINGATTINHKLGRQMQGWFLTDVSAAATVYRSKALNPTTLTLTSNAVCTVDIYVF